MIFKISGAIFLKRQGINVSFVERFNMSFIMSRLFKSDIGLIITNVCSYYWGSINNNCTVYTLIGLAALEQIKIQ